MKVLLVGYSFPPLAGPGLERTLELARALPALGLETHVLAREDEREDASRAAERVPTHAWVHRTRYWHLLSIPVAVRLVREHGIEGVVTVAPPHSVHLVGAAVKRTTGAVWLADLDESPGERMSWLVTSQADAIACGSDEIASVMRARSPEGRLVAVRTDDDAGSTADLLRSLS